MTFTEAALAVLEQAGRPLQVRQIADMAVERGLLSHVGKTPVQTMSAQISAAITREGDECRFVRVRPGVFALTMWKDQPPKKTSTAAVARPQPQRPSTQPRQNKPSRRARGSAGPAVAPPATAASEPAPKPKPEARTETQTPRESRPKAEPARQEQAESATVALEAPRTKRRRTKKARRSVEPAAPVESTATTPARGDVVDRVIAYLDAGSGAVKGSVLATRLGFKGRGAAGALDAVIASDELDRRLSGHSARLARAGQSWKRAAGDGNGAEAELIEQIEQRVDEAVGIAAGQVRGCMADLNIGQLAQVVLVYLGRRGFAEPTPVGHQTERSMHWSVRDPDGSTRAVVLVHDPKLPILNEGFVIRLRGALHHYGAAGGIILTTSDFDATALREAQVINLPPIELIGGEKLSRKLVRQGLGVRKQQIEIPICDASFFSELF